jgi:DNA-binding response OmpR family regulator
MQPFAVRRLSVPLPERLVAQGGTLRRVLFVSADADLRSVVTRVLACQDYEVHAVAHSGHALLHCRTMDFDVMVTELSGPDISGPSLAEQVRRHCPRISVVYLGNPGTPEGVEHVLVRPFTRDDLMERIQVALNPVAA